MNEPITCPYCNNEPEWVENKEVYGRNYGKSYMMYLCRPCDAYVGCHQNTREPLGTLADKQTREYRKKAHQHIDPVWRSGSLSRGEVYARLKKHFGRETHIGSSDVETCKEILNVTF